MKLGDLATTKITIKRVQTVKDSAGFTTRQETELATVSAYREGRHGSERWANLASFSDATDLFVFRRTAAEITPSDVIVDHGERFDILSVELIHGRGIYVEALAKKVEATAHG